MTIWSARTLRGGALAAGLLLAQAAQAETGLTVVQTLLPDEKSVFATVESQNVVPARARLGGTVVELRVHDGDAVTQGQTIALVGDDKLQFQLRAVDAQIAGLKSSQQQMQTELAREEALAQTGATSRQSLDRARTAATLASNALASRTAERAVLEQQMAEGAVLAPISGRVLQVPITRGSVVLPGDALASIAEGNFVLRLSVPERHAASLHVGDAVRLDATPPVAGRITLVYPQIIEGRVRADATAPGLGSYFVGQRVGVWIAAGRRHGIVIPAHLISQRFGLDYVRLEDGSDSPVQRGRDTPLPDMADGVEILSGLRAGDVVRAP